MVVQKLLPIDHLQSLQFSQRMFELIEYKNVVIMMSDKAHFHIKATSISKIAIAGPTKPKRPTPQ